MLQLKDRSLSRNVAETTIVEEPDGRQPSAALPQPQAPVSGTLPRPEIGGGGGPQGQEQGPKLQEQEQEQEQDQAPRLQLQVQEQG